MQNNKSNTRKGDNVQVKEKYSDRRCNPRRRNKRVNLSFEISLPDRDGKTINISASGVYFEVITNDRKAFSPGTTIPLQINTVSNILGCGRGRGTGTVIRNYIIERPDHDYTLGVALEFTEELNIVEDSN